MEQLNLFFLKARQKPEEKNIDSISFNKEKKVTADDKDLLTNDKIDLVKIKHIQKVINKRGRKSFKEINDEINLINVPEDKILFSKQYYSISEVAKWFNVNASLIRFWEKEFDILKLRKNEKGDRLFRPEDVKSIQLIYHLLKQRQFSIEGARKYMQGNKSHAEINKQLFESLTKVKLFLTELKTHLSV